MQKNLSYQLHIMFFYSIQNYVQNFHNDVEISKRANKVHGVYKIEFFDAIKIF